MTVRLIVEQAQKKKLVPSVGRETIRMLLEDHDLKPWREKNVARADVNDIRQMDELLKLYEKPHNPQEPVVCLDEKPVPMHADVRPPAAAQPGQPAKRDGEYKRLGTANVFCAVEPLAGRHFTWPTPDRSASQLAGAIRRLAQQYLWLERFIWWSTT